MTATNQPASDEAKAAWDDANSLAESTQRIVSGSWTNSDSAAAACESGGVRWGLTRLGPAVGADRSVALAAIVNLWTQAGYRPVQKPIEGDAPGVEVRYPEVGTLHNGFFIEFGTTDHGSTLQIQTPCTSGDVDSLNREKYAEKHTNTPPDIPGASSTGATP